MSQLTQPEAVEALKRAGLPLKGVIPASDLVVALMDGRLVSPEPKRPAPSK